jgi:hypothetical protein
MGGEKENVNMPPSSAIKLTLYSENDEKKEEYQRLIVPWGFLKRAVKISKQIGKVENPEDLTDEQLDLIGDLLISFFGNRFTREQLDDGADALEIFVCFKSIVAKAKGLIPNPPPPAK